MWSGWRLLRCGSRRRCGFGFDLRQLDLRLGAAIAERDGRRAQAAVLALDSLQAEVLLELFLGGKVGLPGGGHRLAVLGGFGFQLFLLAKEARFELAGAFGRIALASLRT